jgi:transcription termination/antitermination protein NusG
MYDIEHQELGTGTEQPETTESGIDDTLMADPDGAVEEAPALGNIDGPAQSDIDGPALSEVDGSALSEVDGPALSEVDGSALSEVDGPALSEVDGPALSEVDGRKDNRNWFVVHTYSGYENKVKANLERRIHSMGMQDKIFRVLVPMEDEVEFKDGKRKITPKKVFPGYVLVEMIMDDQSWYVVRNTQGVTGFVGSPGPGEKPVPLQDKEVKTILKQMGIEAPKLKIDFKKGDRVKVTSGPFFDFTGVVDEIAPEKERLRALISIFGRETPVELEFFQVEKV